MAHTVIGKGKICERSHLYVLNIWIVVQCCFLFCFYCLVMICIYFTLCVSSDFSSLFLCTYKMSMCKAI